jgi:hypothetical protein
MSERDAIAGRPRTSSTWLASTGWRSKKPSRTQSITPSRSVPMRDIAEAIGRRLKLPVKSIAPDEAQAYFGWLSMFAGYDMPASSAQTRRKLGWEPKGPGLIADLERLQVSNRSSTHGNSASPTAALRCSPFSRLGIGSCCVLAHTPSLGDSPNLTGATILVSIDASLPTQRSNPESAAKSELLSHCRRPRYQRSIRNEISFRRDAAGATQLRFAAAPSTIRTTSDMMRFSSKSLGV